MSRLGKKPIPAPNGVTVTVKGQDVSVKGPKGTLNFRVHDDVEVAFGRRRTLGEAASRNHARSRAVGHDARCARGQRKGRHRWASRRTWN
jgi:ribosomal protein L6P/L9E